MRFRNLLLAATAALAVSACEVTVNDADQGNGASAEQAQSNMQAAQPGDGSPGDQTNPQAAARARELAATFGNQQERQQGREQARKELGNLRFEVDISDRKLRVFDGEELMEAHDVAVGTEKWPTPTGSWEFHRVDLNPEWIPPKSEEWAEDEERKAPGASDNPMGRARLVYRMPNTVHGTDDLNSLGKAASHGSIRVANKVVIDLAEKLLKAGGAWEGGSWFKRMTENRSEEYQIDLPDRIPIKVQE